MPSAGERSIHSATHTHPPAGRLPGGAGGKEPARRGRPRKRHGLSPRPGRPPGEGDGNPPAILASRVPRTRQPGKPQSMGSQSGQRWSS